MNRLFHAPALLTFAALTLGSIAPANAAFIIGSQGIADIGSPAINSVALDSATVFSFGNLITTAAETGAFAMPSSVALILGPATLDLNNITGFKFGTTDFGTFSGSSFVSLIFSPDVRAFQVNGTFMPGTRYGTGLASVTSSFVVSFTQTAGGGMAISDSGTLSVPSVPFAVPEPTSVVLLGFGLVGLAGLAGRRRLCC